VKKFLHGA